MFVIPPPITLAESNSINVNQTTTGQTTKCVNGTCTTTGGGSKSTVCINGKCTTTEDGSNVDVQSDDSHTQIHINTNTGGNNINNNTDIVITGTPSATITPFHHEKNINKVTPKPSVTPTKHPKSNLFHFDFNQFFKNFFDFKFF
jgi:CCR4-NOT transcriptional regulation complex NOT5 subunit